MSHVYIYIYMYFPTTYHLNLCHVALHGLLVNDTLHPQQVFEGQITWSTLDTMAPGRVLSPSAEAAKAAAKLKELYADKAEQNHLGNHAVELLREVLTQVSIDEQYPELLRIMTFMKTCLLSLRGHLQEWDMRGGPEAWLDLPFFTLPEEYPNDCWTVKHPRLDIFASEVKSCIGFLAAHPTLTGPVWAWLRETLEVLDAACSSSESSGLQGGAAA